MKTKLTILTGFVLAATAASASAGLVDWGPVAENEFGGDVLVRGDTGVTEVAWDTDNYMVNGAGATDGSFYGGWYCDGVIKRWQTAGGLGYEGLRLGDDDNPATDQVGALLWKTDSTDLKDSIEMNTLLWTGTSHPDSPPDIRWMVWQQETGTVYVSDIVGQGYTKENSTTPISSTLAGLNWYSVDLATSMGSAVSAFATDTATVLTGVDGVGVYYRQQADSTVFVDWRVYQYSATPEPATLCLLGLGGVGVLLKRRNRA